MKTILSDAKRKSWRGEDGFTLVEILVVITIIGMIVALVGPRVLNYLGESKVKTAKIQIQSFASALDLFYLDATAPGCPTPPPHCSARTSAGLHSSFFSV